MFDNGLTTFNIMFIVVNVFIVIVFIFTFIYILSPKFRGKVMSRQIKATKHMMDYSKNDFEDMSERLGELSSIAINTKKKILEENEDTLREMSKMEANIKKDSVKTIAKSVKEGLSEASIYCKHCGTIIDSDSKFCKKCRREQ